ncbi:MAG: hypothetical protein FH753_08325 [Firmicutes bacterium]|nr:hypothetical protein [Bacillota bacterium]
MDKNIYKILGITFKEDIISNLLVETINESKIFSDIFLETICDIKKVDEYDCKAVTRMGTSKFGIPDIVIKVVSRDKIYMIIVENKLKAEEGYDQTKRYSNKECVGELSHKIGITDVDEIDTKFIYLTLIPEQIPSGQLFINKTYKDLLESCKDVELENSVLNKLISDYMIVLSRFYSGLEVKDEELILEVLKEDIEAEKIFIRFRNIMNSISYPNNLKVDCGKAGGRGRVSYIAQIYKANWKGSKMIKDENDNWILNYDSYDIHFEAAFDIFTKSLNMPLHYEVNPYSPQRWVKENVKEESYQNYLGFREKVQKALKNEIIEKDIKDIKTYNGYNQMLRIKFDITDDTTVKEFKEKIISTTGFVSNIIDKILGSLN